MSSNVDHQVIAIESRVEKWVKEFVVNLGLCPFARHVVDNELIRYKVSTTVAEVELLTDFEAELLLLQQNPSIATSLLITPLTLGEFEDYLDFLDSAQQLLEDLELVGIFQLASFHPHYQFADTAPDAPENFSNRSPYPMIHILRENLVKSAVEAYGDASAIPAKNIELLRKMDREALQLLTEELSSSRE